eukprot:GSMAST32.ASY1.ANO1.931.1 assembled CDS
MHSISGAVGGSATFHLPIQNTRVPEYTPGSRFPQTPGSALNATLGNLNLGTDVPTSLLPINRIKKKQSVHTVLTSKPLTITYGHEISLRCGVERGFLGANDNGSLIVSGTGNNADAEIFTLVNIHLRSDTGPVRYGDSIALCSHSCGVGEGKFLACETNITDISKLRIPGGDRKKALTTKSGPALNRTSFGSAEKWTILSASTPGLDRNSKTKNSVVCAGDRVILRCIRGTFLSSSSISQNQQNQNMQTPIPTLTPKSTSASWIITKGRTPWMPDWSRTRLFLTGDFLSCPSIKDTQTKCSAPDLNDHPLELQEHIIIEDLLYTMVGIEGRYIRIIDTPNISTMSHSTEITFSLDSNVMDASLGFLVKRFLPLCNHYAWLERFVTRHMGYEFGRTAHAFCAAVKQLLREYVLTQLEHKYRMSQLSVQKLWFYVQNSLHLMQSLKKVCNANAQQLFHFLTKKSAAPYLRMLEQWIYRGVVNDNHSEFMISENRQLSKERLADDYNAHYWDKRCTICDHQIFTTGKYLNVIRECGRAIDCPLITIDFVSAHSGYSKIIDDANKFASRTLLDMLLQDAKLMDHLASLRLFFFQAKGDVFVHFMNIASSELDKNFVDIDIGKLESLLNVAICDTTMDTNADHITCTLEPLKLFHLLEAVHTTSTQGSSIPRALRSAQMHQNNSVKGIDSFSLDYRVEWPLSLVISRQTIIKYQILFRHLFFCKYVECQLCEAWVHQHTAKELSVQVAMRVSYCLRQRMLHFVQNLVYYVTVEVLEPRWHEMKQKLRKASTVDEVLSYHNDFLDCCLKESLLTNPVLIRLLTKLMTTCLLFSNKVKNFYATSSLQSDKESRVSAVQSNDTYRRSRRARGGVSKGSQSSKYYEEAGGERNFGAATRKAGNNVEKRRARRGSLDLRRTRIEVQSAHIRNFDALLMSFMAALQDEHHVEYHMHLANVFTRLDFNKFYANRHNEAKRNLSRECS